MKDQRIRIRLKAFDHALIDASTKKLSKQQNVQVHKFVDQYLCRPAKNASLS